MKWQPIETAPKNPAGEFYGPMILVFCAADNMPWPANWAPSKNGGGAWQVFDGEEIRDTDATHWMPLPPPPTE